MTTEIKLKKQFEKIESNIEKVKEVLDNYNTIVNEATLSDLSEDLFYEVVNLRSIIKVAQEQQKDLKSVYEEVFNRFKGSDYLKNY